MTNAVENLSVDETVQNRASFSTWRMITMIVVILVPLVNFGVPAFLDSQDRFADDPQTRVNAAGYAFAIWAVIFTGMILFSGFLLFGDEPHSEQLNRGLICLSIAGVASIAFVPISIYGNQVLGWIDILFHLIPLAIANRMLRIHAKLNPSSAAGRWTFFGPSMYFGWISTATVISTALMANQLGIELGELLATTTAVAVVVLLAAFGIWMTIVRDPIYGATVSWALIAVGVEQSAFPIIRTVAWVGAGFLVVAVVYQLTLRFKYYAVN